MRSAQDLPEDGRTRQIENVMTEDTIIQFSEAPMSTESVFNELVKIQSWPSAVLVFALVIIVGYCLRFWKSFPNQAIPTVVILVGACGMLLLSDKAPDAINSRIWHTRNFVVGLTIGFVAWMAHNLVISKIEDFLANKFEFINRAFGNKITDISEDPKP